MSFLVISGSFSNMKKSDQGGIEIGALRCLPPVGDGRNQTKVGLKLGTCLH